MEEQKKMKEVEGMFDGKVAPLLIKMSLPILMGMLMQLVYNITDTIFVSRIDLSDSSIVGGIGLIWPVLFFVMAIASGLMVGCSSIVARAIGEKDTDLLDKVADSALFLAITFSVIFITIFYIFGDQITTALASGGSGSLAGDELRLSFIKNAQDYLYFIIPSGVALFVGQVLMGILQGEGQMKYFMNAMLIGTGLNIVLDFLFIIVFKWGIKGAAGATSVAQMISLIYTIYLFAAKKVNVPVHWKWGNVKLSVMGKITAIGLPQSAGMMLLSLSFLFLNTVVIGIDEHALTAFSLCGRLDQAVLMPSFALGAAMITIMGQNGGRGLYTRVKETWYKGIFLGMISVFVIAIAMILLAPWIYSFFTDVDEVLSYTVRQTQFMELFFVAAVVGILGRSAFQATGYPWSGLVVVLIRLIIIALPLGWFLAITEKTINFFNLSFTIKGIGLGIPGIWYGMATGSIIAMVVCLFWVGKMLTNIENGKIEFKKA